MKKLILFIVLIFTTLNVYANWIKVVTDEEIDIYVKTDSIKRKDYMVTFWEMYDFKSTQTADGKPYNSIKMKSEINCSSEENRTIFYAPYSENMGLGKPLEHVEIPGKKFSIIVPDTINHTVSKFICSKK